MEKNEALKFGRFFCEELLGSNGTTETFKARMDDLRGLEQRFAVKLLRPDRGGDDPAIAERFVEAGRRAASLTDPGIVRVVEVSAEKGAVFVASEFVDGLDLQILAEDTVGKTGKPIDAAMVTHIGVSAAQALATAHRRPDPVLHLGLSPRNIMLTSAGEVKLLDFGLSAAVRDRTTDDVSRWLYVAPEIMAGGKGSPRSDLYSLGIVLYEMLMGRPPFNAESIDELEKMTRRPPLLSFADTPDSLATAIRALVEPRPEDRPESAAAAALLISGVSDIRRRLSQVVAVVRGDGPEPAATAQRRPGVTLMGAGEPPPVPPKAAMAAPPGAGPERTGRLAPLDNARGRPSTPPRGVPVSQSPPRRVDAARPPARHAAVRVEEVQGVVFDPSRATGGAVRQSPSVERNSQAWALPDQSGFEVSSLSEMATGAGLVVEVEGGEAVPAFEIDPKDDAGRARGSATGSFGDSFFDVPSPGESQTLRGRPRAAGVRPTLPGTSEPALTLDRGSGGPGSSLSPDAGVEFLDLGGAPLDVIQTQGTGAAAAASPRRPPPEVRGNSGRPKRSEGGSARVDARASLMRRATGLAGTSAFIEPWYSPRRFLIPILMGVAVPAGIGAWWLFLRPHAQPSVTANKPPIRPQTTAAASPKPTIAATGKGRPSPAPAPGSSASPAATGKPSARPTGSAAPTASPVPTAVAVARPAARVPGQLRVETIPDGAVVWVDGEEKGKTPFQMKLEEGGHRLVVIKEGFQTIKEAVDASEGEVLRRNLEPGVKPPRGEAGIKVRCLTSGKFPVIVDGHETGLICPTERIDLTPGEHEVAIFVPKDREVYAAKIAFEPSRSSTRVHFKY